MTREEAIKDIEENIKPYVGGKSLDMAVEALKQPEQKKGKWIENEDRAGWHCSCCGVDNYYAYSWNCETGKNDFQDNYCPSCGADMREGEEWIT